MEKSKKIIASALAGTGVGVITGAIVRRLTDSNKAGAAAMLMASLTTTVAARAALDQAEKIEKEYDDYEDDDSNLLNFTGDQNDPNFIPAEGSEQERVRIYNSEVLRDMCGSFHDLSGTCRNYGLMYDLADAVSRYTRKQYANQGLTDDQLREKVYEAQEYVLDCLYEDPRTHDVLLRYINSNGSIDDFTKEEVVAILDVAYVDALSVDVEIDAADRLKNKEFEPFNSVAEQRQLLTKNTEGTDPVQ